MKYPVTIVLCLALALTLASGPALAAAATAADETAPEEVHVERFENGLPRLVITKTDNGRVVGRMLTLPGRAVITSLENMAYAAGAGAGWGSSDTL